MFTLDARFTCQPLTRILVINDRTQCDFSFNVIVSDEPLKKRSEVFPTVSCEIKEAVELCSMCVCVWEGRVPHTDSSIGHRAALSLQKKKKKNFTKQKCVG